MEEEKWVSIIEYSRIRNKSISTIRRYIKANRVEHKMVDGKYHLKVKPSLALANQKTELSEKLEIERLKLKIKQLEEENADLKMLVNIYEANEKSLPELPHAQY